MLYTLKLKQEGFVCNPKAHEDFLELSRSFPEIMKPFIMISDPMDMSSPINVDLGLIDSFSSFCNSSDTDNCTLNSDSLRGILELLKDASIHSLNSIVVYNNDKDL